MFCIYVFSNNLKFEMHGSRFLKYTLMVSFQSYRKVVIIVNNIWGDLVIMPKCY